MAHKFRVGIFRTYYPAASETFISSQSSLLRSFTCKFFVRKPASQIAEASCIPKADFRGKVQACCFAATGWWIFFWAKREILGMNVLHAHFGQDGLYALPLSRRSKVPLIVTFHGSDATIGRRALMRSGVWSNIRFALLERRLKRNAARFIAVSDFVRRSLIAKGYPQNKIIRHYIGVDTDAFSPGDRLANARYVLCVARHVAVKGVDDLLRAFGRISKAHPDVRLVLAGEGPLTESLKQLASALGISSVVDFVGVVSHEQVKVLMQSAEVFALFGRRLRNGSEEGLGLVFNEASACEIPIVATRIGGIPEAVHDAINGYLVAPGDIESFAERLHLLLSNSHLARKMGKAGRVIVRQAFDLKTQCAALEKVYLDVIDEANLVISGSGE